MISTLAEGKLSPAQNVGYFLALLFLALTIWVLLMIRRRLPNEKPVSFGITDDQGGMFFVEAHGFQVDLDGRLIFWERRGLIRHEKSIVERGKWERVLEGISMEDFEEDG